MYRRKVHEMKIMMDQVALVKNLIPGEMCRSTAMSVSFWSLWTIFPYPTVHFVVEVTQNVRFRCSTPNSLSLDAGAVPTIRYRIKKIAYQEAIFYGCQQLWLCLL